MLNTPILFLVFNRLDATQQVFAKIREAQPHQLFIGADGARVGKEGEAGKVEAVRKYILDNINWDCEVKTFFRERNVGCGIAVSEAITWFFENVEQGIILEDDCLPDASFFTFCEDLLNYYKDNERIMHIGGNNYFNKPQKNTYYFSKYVHPPHGWASWKRAWKKYDHDMKDLPAFQADKRIYQIIKNKQVASYWEDYFNFHERTNLDTWDTQWQLSLFVEKGLAIMPYMNLVANVGYNADATHTTNAEHRSNINITFETKTITHPPHIKVEEAYDDAKIEYVYMHKLSFVEKVKNLIPSFFKKILKKLYANQN